MSDQHTSEHVIDKRYQMKGVLGKGGMGIVYHVFDKVLGIDVAIKMLQPDAMGLASIRLQREAIAAGKMQNANIARIFDFGQASDGSPYMVMELVSGISLSQFINENGALPYKTAMRIFVQICQGLAHAHSNNIVHRDLKPSNVMLIEQADGSHLAKILDFGVAKMETDQHLTSTGSILGSPLYMSPEQADGLAVDFKSDIYSLGCLMFETLTGQPPLKGKSALETMSMHKNVAPPLVSEVTSDPMPPELVDLVDSCLRKRTEDRPESAKSIENKLDGILNPIVTESASPAAKPVYRPETEMEKRLSKFSKNTALVIGALLMVGVVLVLYLSYQHFETKHKAETEGATKVHVELKETANKDADDNYNKNTNFEYGYSEGQRVLLTKKSTRDSDLADIVNSTATVLRIKKGKVKGSGLAYLAKIPLTGIEISSSGFDCRFLSYLKNIKTLKKANLILSDLSDEHVKIIAGVESLEELSIRDAKLITDKGVEYLLSLPNLKKLELIQCPRLSKDVGKKVAQIRTLTEFTMPCMQSPSSLKALQNSNVVCLGIFGLNLNAKELETICANRKLKSLWISNIQMKDNDYSALSKLSGLEKLDLTLEVRFLPELFSALTKVNVPTVDLSNSYVTPKSLHQFINNPYLKKITCDACKGINTKDITAFTQAYEKKWKHPISVTKIGLDEDEIKDFKEMPFIIDPSAGT